MITVEEWAKLKGSEQYGMYASLAKRMDVLESTMNLLLDAEEMKLKQLRLRMYKGEQK